MGMMRDTFICAARVQGTEGFSEDQFCAQEYKDCEACEDAFLDYLVRTKSYLQIYAGRKQGKSAFVRYVRRRNNNG